MNATRLGCNMRTVLLNCGPIAHLDNGNNKPFTGSLIDDVENLVKTSSSIVMQDDVIQSIDDTESISSEYLSTSLTNSKNKSPSVIQSSEDLLIWDVCGLAVIPGLIDAHTHLLWAGDRSREVLWKQAGYSYSQIADMGGGIGHTVSETRSASDNDLITIGVNRMKIALNYGTTMMEVKSGYGLDTESELRLLNCAHKISSLPGMPKLDLTWLGAHATPPGRKGASKDDARKSYVEEIISEQLPRVIEQGYARSSDVFCEPGWFTLEETHMISESAMKGGLDIRLHVDEFCDGGGMNLAAELGATTADHAYFSPLESRKKASEKGTLQGFLLGTPHSMGMEMPPVSECVENDIAYTLATDFNPNCNSLSLPFIGSLAVQRCNIDPLSALAAVTTNAASGIVRDDGLQQGVLRKGAIANLNILRSVNWESWCLHQGTSPIEATFISGKSVDIEKTLNI